MAEDSDLPDELGAGLASNNENDTVEELPNGDAILTIEDEEAEEEDIAAVEDHFENIVDEVDQAKLLAWATEIKELVERDKEARDKRDKQYAEALQRTGLGNDAPGGATFDGASKAVHPGMTQAAVDFASRVIKEIFPPNGPVKDKIVGDVTAEKVEKARRKTRYMNWQLTQQIRDFRSELEQLLPQAALAGVGYIKMMWDERKQRPTAVWRPQDEIWLPYAATNFYTAERKTDIQDITEFEYNSRVKSGMYRDGDLVANAQEPDESAAKKANDKIEGVKPSSYNEDGLRRIYEVYCYGEPEAEGDLRPYILSIDSTTGTPIGLYRNWEQDDEEFEDLIWHIAFPLVPWRGAYPIGLIHMIGGLSGAATGALRALLDSAHINNFPTVLKIKGGDRGGQSVSMQPTQVNEIEGSSITDDVRKTMMPVPFNPPSPVLFQLLGFLVDAQNSVVRTTYEDLAENSTNMPVGTAQALIEQGMVVFSAIHGRMHDAMGRLLEVLHRINRMYLDDEVTIEELGDLIVHRSDFEGPLDVVPVSDPNVFSEVQRVAQIQAVMARSDAKPGLYDPIKVEKLFLERTKIPDAESLLIEPPKPTELNQVNENLAAMMGRPIVVFPEQDHLAHLATLLPFMSSPIFGQNPIVAGRALPILLQHMSDHLGMWYVNEIYRLATEAAGKPLEEYMGSEDAHVNRKLDDLLAAASARVITDSAGKFKELPPIIQQCMQAMQQFAPKPPMDPTQALIAETARKTQADQAKAQTDQQKTQLDAAKLQQEPALQAQDHQSDMELEQARQQSENQRAILVEQGKELMNDQDNQTAKEIAVMETVVAGHKAAVENGGGVNPNP